MFVLLCTSFYDLFWCMRVCLHVGFWFCGEVDLL
jgi:hypothetical protein